MMSSAETLNFGPQWLRDLSEGSSNTPTSPPATQTVPISKFKLAENRYGREELLALFVEDSEVPEELHRAPSLVSEIVQIPLALRPSNDLSHGQLSTSYRGRGVSSGLRGRSIPSRGRGRGRGSAWADQDDGPLRRPPLLRRSESEDWRSDSLRGKGDGAEDIMGGLKEWRTVGGQRNDFWKDTWRDRQGDVNETRYPRGRSLSSREADESDRHRREDGFDDLSVNSNHSDSVKEARGKEPSKTKDGNRDKKEPPPSNGDTNDSPPVINQGMASSATDDEEKHTDVSTNVTLPERPLKSLEPVLEAGKMQETGSPVDQDPDPPKQENIEPTLQDGKKNLEDMFQKLSANDPSNLTGKNALPQVFQEVRRSDPQSTSLGSTGAQTHAFSTNPPLGEIPVTSTSPIAQLQLLASTWYYKDPQGDIQGPFSSNQMMEWFNAGYFTMVLLVKRACDKEFAQLGELIKRWGHVPFASSQKPGFPNVSEPDVPTSSMLQQQQMQMQYSKLLQSQKQQHHLQQVHHQQQLQHTKPQQPPIGSRGSYSQLMDFEMILSKLLKNPEFCNLPKEHQQLIVQEYAEELKRHSRNTDSIQPVPIQQSISNAATGLHNTIQGDALQQQTPNSLLQQKLLEEARKKEEEEIRRMQKQQQEQKELLRKQEEEFQRKKEMLMREQEEIKQLQIEAQRKKEELQRKIEEDERLKHMREMEELERRRKLEEEERRRQQIERDRREAEMRRIQVEEERSRREAERKRLEEEEARRLEEQRQQEMRQIELEREEQRLEEMKKQEEHERQLAAKEAEMQRKAEAARLQKEKEAEAKSLLKKQQQEKQMQQMQLPSHAKWAHGQPHSSKNESLSLVEIQKIEKQEEKTRLLEEARMVREIRSQVPKPKTGWGTPSQEAHGVSLLDIQREEAKQMSLTKQAAKPEKPPVLNFNTSWNKPPKIQPDVPKPKAKAQASFWDQVVEENPKKTNLPAKPNQSKSQKQAPQKQVKQQPKGAKQKAKGNEGQQIKALFQQQITKDSFTDWCEGYLKQMNVGSIDIPTFVNFLRDVESPYEVQEYVQSYLGESKEAKDFTTLFLEQRAKLGGHSYKPPASEVFDKPRSGTARDTDGFEMVTANSKRGKKKLKKLQKVDPSILGFSVNAASNRVNMGEIQSADD